MDVSELKNNIIKVLDEWASKQPTIGFSTTEVVTPTSSVVAPPATEEPGEREDGKRVVRTKNSGDRVFLLDDTKKSRQWITKPEVLAGLGFKMEDVGEVDDAELMKYAMGPALYKLDD